ncbi:hypothetical protein NHQ30_002798 [Ciborinia camelliae]|nr:hypothetical protein NHQ30_002798 [Ciborinia camelliae]
MGRIYSSMQRISNRFFSWTRSEKEDEVDITPQTFPQFPNFPTELRLKIWRYAAFQPRIICATPDGREGFGCFSIVPTQQCPLATACGESRGVALSHKKPIKLKLSSPNSLVAKTRILNPEAKPHATTTIYVNLDIDIIRLHLLEEDFPYSIRTLTVGLRPFYGVKHVILPSGRRYINRKRTNYEQLPGSIMPSQHYRYLLTLDEWALEHDIQDVYYLLGDDDFTIDEEGTEFPHLFEGRMHNSPASFVPKIMARSLEDIDKGWKEFFNDCRIDKIKSAQKGLKNTIIGSDDAKWLKGEIGWLESWKPPKIKYIRESQVNALLG